jgi:hypothetical protein
VCVWGGGVMHTSGFSTLNVSHPGLSNVTEKYRVISRKEK